MRKQHNTTHACMALIKSIRNTLDKGDFAAGIFVDLQKAFRTQESKHKILILKLSHYGVQGTADKLFQSYLSNRTQFVQVRNSPSKLAEIQHGEPQGSVLWTFNISDLHINDLHFAIKHSKTFHFADDTCLPYSHNQQLN